MTRSISAEFDKLASTEWSKKRCGGYRDVVHFPLWRLNYACKNSDMCACLEIDRRERHALPGSTRYAEAVGSKRPDVLPSGVEVYRQKLSKEYRRLQGLPRKQLKAIITEWAKERKAHPTLSSKVVLQIAKDHLAYEKRPRKRWKRRKK